MRRGSLTHETQCARPRTDRTTAYSPTHTRDAQRSIFRVHMGHHIYCFHRRLLGPPTFAPAGFTAAVKGVTTRSQHRHDGVVSGVPGSPRQPGPISIRSANLDRCYGRARASWEMTEAQLACCPPTKPHRAGGWSGTAASRFPQDGLHIRPRSQQPTWTLPKDDMTERKKTPQTKAESQCRHARPNFPGSCPVSPDGTFSSRTMTRTTSSRGRPVDA